jgi:hypothetical protein
VPSLTNRLHDNDLAIEQQYLPCCDLVIAEFMILIPIHWFSLRVAIKGMANITRKNRFRTAFCQKPDHKE